MLTSREIEVITKMSQGLTTKEIAEVLNLSYYTVETHRKNILEKSGCNNVARLMLWAVEHNFLSVKTQ